MGYNKTSGKLTKAGQVQISKFLESPYVDNYHKTQLKGIMSRSKNLSSSDASIMNLIFNQYK